MESLPPRADARSRLKGASAETKGALKALNAELEQFFPADRVSSDGLFQALGFTTNMDFIFEGLTLFVLDGLLYAKTRKVMPAMTDILGSEFYEAERALRLGGDA